MRYVATTLCALLALFLLAFVHPAASQTTLTVAEDLASQGDLVLVDTKAQQALDGTVVLASTQGTIEQRLTALEDLVAAQALTIADQANTIANLEAAPATWPAHTMFSLNALQYGAGNNCTTPDVGTAVSCPHNITDWEGDDTDVRGGCDIGTYDALTEIYTPDPLDTTGGPYKCTLRASDPVRTDVEHVSVLVITVTP